MLYQNGTSYNVQTFRANYPLEEQQTEQLCATDLSSFVKQLSCTHVRPNVEWFGIICLRVGGHVQCEQRVLNLCRLMTQFDVCGRLTVPRTRLHTCVIPITHLSRLFISLSYLTHCRIQDPGDRRAYPPRRSYG